MVGVKGFDEAEAGTKKIVRDASFLSLVAEWMRRISIHIIPGRLDLPDQGTARWTGMNGIGIAQPTPSLQGLAHSNRRAGNCDTIAATTGKSASSSNLETTEFATPRPASAKG